MLTRDFSFEFPPELVAQEPLSDRDASRMMVLERKNQTIGHSSFLNFPSFFKRGDLLVLNNTKVLPARLLGKKKTGGRVEVLLVGPFPFVGANGLKPVTGRSLDSNVWKCLLRSMKGIHEGDEIFFGGQERVSAIFRVINGKTKVLEFPPEVSVPDLMKKEGAAPLPPYIKRPQTRPEDLERYQTIFAEREGAIAAPTASLHFTPKILSELQSGGVEILYVTLHVGVGTFQPVTAERVEDHVMQTESYEISPLVVESVLSAKKEGRSVTAVGTTTVRAIESYFSSQNPPNPPFSTHLFIHPGYNFKVIDRLLTNFHQPESTPLFLTSTFAGKEFLFRAYQEAIEKRYRLFSYGDCMLVL